MRVILRNATRCDADETCLLQCLDVLSTAITHTGTYASYKLEDSLRELTLEWHSANDTLGNELVDIALGTLLEVAVGRTGLHSIDRAHTSVCLELTAIVDDSIAG